jgi:LPS sulfotransferase NodH
MSAEARRLNRPPVLSYVICATHRSGSQLLCELLRNTRVAGWPFEYFLPRSEARDKAVVASPDSFRMDVKFLPRIVAGRQTSNGVFGIKVMASYLDEFVEWLRLSRPDLSGAAEADVVGAALPNERYVHLTRADRALQAVSLVRATRTGAYEARDGDPAVPFDGGFDFDAVHAAVQDLEREEARWLRFFEDARVRPHVVRYEDLVADRAREVIGVLEALGIEAPASRDFVEVQLRKQGDGINEAWAAAYRAAVSR